jgi:ABC-type transporter Mla maintaining outer membrane lipid asymmetry ATPase subunit MlaF
MKETIDSLRFRITKRFGTKTVLQDFGLEVRGTQFITFLGPSGCGKSTATCRPRSGGSAWSSRTTRSSRT